jgi:NADH-quinone oxidoreductase subunit L
MSDEQDMRKMGGLWKKIPFTYVMMWTGSLALAGIPPFAGFYSKDIVMEAAYAANNWSGQLAFWMSLAAALMTSFYSWRLIIMTFHGKSRASSRTSRIMSMNRQALCWFRFSFSRWARCSRARSSTSRSLVVRRPLRMVKPAPVMKNRPLITSRKPLRMKLLRMRLAEKKESGRASLSGATAFLCLMKTIHWRPRTMRRNGLNSRRLWLVCSVSLWRIIIYMTGPGVPEKVRRAVPALHALSFNKWYFDEIYDYLFVRRAFGFGRIFTKADRKIIDRFGPDGGATASGATARLFSRFQTGFIYQYAFVMMIAVISLLSWFVFRAGQGG